MDPVHAALTAALREAGLGRDTRVLVACSAGADSVALLRGLASLGQRVACGHVHHGLRSDAESDLSFVQRLAQRLGVPFGARRVDAARPDGRSPEARARVLRYAALEELRVELSADWIATAHTSDDQAETVLLRAIRGTGPTGLAGIAPRSDITRLLRPLLTVRRADLRSYLERCGQRWREDPSNADLSIPRNRLRRQVLPLLEQIHAGAAGKLAELAELALEAREDAAPRIDAVLSQALRPAQAGCWLDAAPLRALVPSERRRALARVLERAGLAARVTRVHLERMERFLEQAPRSASLSLPGGSLLQRCGERFWLGAAADAPGASREKPRGRAGFRILLPRADSIRERGRGRVDP